MNSLWDWIRVACAGCSAIRASSAGWVGGGEGAAGGGGRGGGGGGGNRQQGGKPRPGGVWPASYLADLGHERQQVALGVLKEGHPEFVVRHACDEMGLGRERDGPALEGRRGGVNVVDQEVEN